MMNKYNFAIVDSGLSEKYGKLIDHNGIGFSTTTDNLIEINNNFKDESGHGTACTHIINSNILYKYKKDFTYYIIKILNKNNLSYPEFLINALDHLLYIDTDIINLSLSLYDDYYIKDIKDIIMTLLSQDKIIITSADNKKYINVLTNIPGIYTVSGIPDMAQNQIIIDKNYLYTSNIPVFVPYIDCINRYYFFGGNSKAAALASNIIMQIKQINNITSNSTLMEYIKKYSPYYLNSSDNINHDIEHTLKSNMILKEILSNYIGDNSVFNCKNLFEIGINKFNAFNVIQDMENQFNINIDYTKITLNNFQTITSLLNVLNYSI